ncbi:hypothetical protein FDECE_17240 [Fusarium decemcellulare]|nr:hypothetical protein FDECE_17240 [Fusarium decemcellulare]
MARHWHPQAIAQITLRSFQFLFAVISAALYAADLAHWSANNIHAHPSWIYAEVAAALAALSSIAQWWLALPRPVAVTWDCVICLLWLVAVAVFGQNISKSAAIEQEFSMDRVRAAVAIDAVNMTLWLVSAIEACWCCSKTRKQKQCADVEEVDVIKRNETKISSDDPPPYAKVENGS